MKSTDMRKVYNDPTVPPCQAAYDLFYWLTAEGRRSGYRCGPFELYILERCSYHA